MERPRWNTITSTDGITWTPNIGSQCQQMLGAIGYLESIGKYVSAGCYPFKCGRRSRTAGVSDDGLQWTMSPAHNIPSFAVHSVMTRDMILASAYDKGKLKCAVTTDGVNWTDVVFPTFNNTFNISVSSVCDKIIVNIVSRKRTTRRYVLQHDGTCTDIDPILDALSFTTSHIVSTT